MRADSSSEVTELCSSLTTGAAGCHLGTTFATELFQLALLDAV